MGITLRVASDQPDDRGLVGTWLGDGPALLQLTAIGLTLAGLFAWFLAATDQLLPHDLAWLTIDEAELRSIADGRLVHFMAHDRAAFGGTLVAVGVLYSWLVRFPLAAGETWAWWLLALGGGFGFLTFLTYLGTGYLDSWHAVATAALLPPFLLGLRATRPNTTAAFSWRVLLRRAPPPPPGTAAWLGRGLLLLTATGMIVAGVTIVTIGTAVVFVPQDLDYIGLDRAALDAIDPRLVPLIAHDRSGFGAGLTVAGITMLGVVWCTASSRSRWEALLIAGVAGFGAAVGVHGVVGYLDAGHVGPALLGALIFAAAMALTRPRAGTVSRAVPAPG